MSEVNPPRIVFRILGWFCPAHLYEQIEGDLIQRFNSDVKQFGEKKATRRLIRNSILFFRAGVLLRNRFYIRKTNLMLASHLRIVWRQTGKSKAFSLINILGLTLGITVSLLIAQFVMFEHSFDRFTDQTSRTYRVNLYNTQNGVFTGISPGTVSGLGYSMKQSLPGIESVARISSRTTAMVAAPGSGLKAKESEMAYADPSILDALGVHLTDGDKRDALRDPNTILVSESIALKYFGTRDAAGKLLEIGFTGSAIEWKPYRITGVFRDIPSNSHQHFNFLMSPQNEQAWNANWDWSDVQTYVVLTKGVDPTNLDAGLAQLVKQHHTDSVGDKYLLEPVTGIRLHARDGSGRASLVNFFIILGVIILLLAWFNYINLCTARFFERMKEVGVRKLIGAGRGQLVVQFLTESFVFNSVSFLTGVSLFFLLWPLVTALLQVQIPITLFDQMTSLLFALGFIMLATFCTGFYPALFLSSFKPLQSLKGNVTTLVDRAMLRKVIVAVQLSVTIALLTAVLAVRQQINFMNDQPLGIAIDQTLILEEPLLTDASTVQKYETFRNELLRLKDVQQVTYASSFPGAEIDWNRSDLTIGQENEGLRYSSRIVSIGTEFVDAFRLTIKAGRNFDSRESDKKAMLISEEACRMFGFASYAEALGKLVFIGSRKFEVIGVLNNYHYRSLQTKIEPLLYIQGYPRNPRYAVKIVSKNIPETLSQIEEKWKTTYSGNAFQYFFLDDYFDRQYSTDRQLGTIVAALTCLAVIISCSGLFGLSLYAVNRRIREIGIRKVLGASLRDIGFLVTRDFVKLTAVGGAVAVPLIYVIIDRWLERYAYKMELTGSLFMVPIVTVLVLTLFTISFQAVTAARQNPIDAMRHE